MHRQIATAPPPAPAWLAAPLGAALLAALGLSAATGSEGGFTAIAILLAGGAIVYLALRSDPAWPLSIGLAAAVFSGFSSQLGLPVGADRLLIACGLLALVLREVESARADEDSRISIEPVHWVLLAASLWALGSAYWAGTLTSSDGFFSVLDRFGLVPFLMFLAAPIAFAEARQRRILLGVLTLTGGYLGLTALFEGVGLDAAVVPAYITDPSVGIHFGRARGPFAEAVANGLSMFGCGVAAVIFASGSRRGSTGRTAGIAVAVLCASGLVFTLTRGAWLAAVVGTIVALASFREVRRYLLPTMAGLAAVVGLALVAVPGLWEQVSSRSADREPLWVRSNTNHAALEMVQERPIAGFGWNSFPDESLPYFEQASGFPINGVGEGVHNVLLSNAVELGLIGAALWLGGLLLAVGGAIVRRGPPEMLAWRVGLVAFAAAWVTVAAVGPLAYAFPTLLLWTWAGVVFGCSRSVRTHSPGPPPDEIRASRTSLRATTAGAAASER